jgi:hypothetical protein
LGGVGAVGRIFASVGTVELDRERFADSVCVAEQEVGTRVSEYRV